MKTVQTTLLSTVAAALTLGAIAYWVVAGNTATTARSGEVVLTQDGRMKMIVTAEREAPARLQDVSHGPAPLAKDAASI